MVAPRAGQAAVAAAVPREHSTPGWRRWFTAWMRPRAPEALPLVLDRRRIYVLPTGFGLFLGVLLVAMGLAALNENNNPALLLVLLLAGTAQSALLATHLQLSGLDVVALDAEPVAAGQPLRLRLHLADRAGRERAGLMVGIGADTVFARVPANGQSVADLVLPTTRRGWQDAPRITLANTRPLGLARAWSVLWPTRPLLVYPAPETHGPPLPSQGTGARSRARPQLHGDEMHQLRQWRSGDARHAIAWKASARRGHWLVREDEQPAGEVLVLDWQATHPLAYEARIRRLAHWVQLAERQGRRYALQLPDTRFGPGLGAAHRHRCLAALALLPDA
jgi:uncharacterized protein (DUF58 family)